MRFIILSTSILATMIGLSGCSFENEVAKVIVKNHLNIDRNEEMIEINLADLQKESYKNENLAVYDNNGNKIASQITYDKKLIFNIDIAAEQSVTFSIKQGKVEKEDTFACGKIYHERLDDLAWENDKAAYRAYGPTLQKSGEKAFGYDVFTKNVPYPVVEERYRMELDKDARNKIRILRQQKKFKEADSISRAISYHIDHGNGMDCYNVGPTLGGGTAALMNGDNIVYPYCYTKCNILDNGPLRFTAELTYKPFKIDDTDVTEKRIISLDKGSFLNMTSVSYSGLKEKKNIASGIVIHPQNPNGYKYSTEKRYIAYADSTNNPNKGNGVIFVGAVFEKGLKDTGIKTFSNEEAKKIGAIGHVIGYSEYKPGDEFVYYWGSGWSKGYMKNMDEWIKYLEDFSTKLNSPLEITIK